LSQMEPIDELVATSRARRACGLARDPRGRKTRSSLRAIPNGARFEATQLRIETGGGRCERHPVGGHDVRAPRRLSNRLLVRIARAPWSLFGEPTAWAAGPASSPSCSSMPASRRPRPRSCWRSFMERPAVSTRPSISWSGRWTATIRRWSNSPSRRSGTVCAAIPDSAGASSAWVWRRSSWSINSRSLRIE
jgi:hypothetical protein